MSGKQRVPGACGGNHRWEITAGIDDWSPETSSVWMGHKVIRASLRGKSRGQRTNDLCANGSDGGGDVVFLVLRTKRTTKEIIKQRTWNRSTTVTMWSEQIPWTPLRLVLDVMCLFHLFLSGLETSLFSLETASVLSHSNLKIEMSLLGSMAVMAATSCGLFNCAVNIWRGDKMSSVIKFQ